MPRKCRNCGERARKITKVWKNVKKNSQFFITSCLKCKKPLELDALGLDDLDPHKKRED